MIPSTPPITGDGIFDDTPLETVYVVDVNAKRVYLAQEPWNYYAIVVMPTGIEELETDKTSPSIVGYYDLSGRPINGKQRGAVILRYSDGTSRKVLVKQAGQQKNPRIKMAYRLSTQSVRSVNQKAFHETSDHGLHNHITCTII